MDNITITVDPPDDESEHESYSVVSVDEHEPRDVFCQMDVLRKFNDDVVWKEMRRCVSNAKSQKSTRKSDQSDGWFNPFRYFVLSLRYNDNLSLFSVK